jgi:hypothetical protein
VKGCAAPSCTVRCATSDGSTTESTTGGC